MTDLKAIYKPEDTFNLVTIIHDKLMARYGAQRTSDWVPTKENVLMLSDEEYINRYKQLSNFEEKDAKERMEIQRGAKGSIAYAHFPTSTMMFKEKANAQKTLVLQQSSAHEELHLWCKRNKIDTNNISYYVNEQFIDYLALRALDLMDVHLSLVPEELRNHIVNALHVHEILDSLGEDSDKLLFDVCQGKSQETLKEKLNNYFGQGPPSNEVIQAPHGTDFYGRFKDLAAIAYLTGRNPNFQKDQAVQACGKMILEWVSKRKEIKHLSRSDLTL